MSEFQSTGLIRGPTQGPFLLSLANDRFNPQASYEARQTITAIISRWVCVSIHRPHTRPDLNFSFGPTIGVSSFNPQASYEARPALADIITSSAAGFNPQASYEARRSKSCHPQRPHRFNPQASYEARLPTMWFLGSASCFNPQASYEARL